MPTRNHAIKNLRNILEASREKFAETVSISKESIYSIESGRMKLSERMAKRIEIATGADALHLVKGSKGSLKARIHPTGENSQPHYTDYTLEIFKEHIHSTFQKTSFRRKLDALVLDLNNIHNSGDERALTDAVLTTYEAMETVRNICNKVCPRESNE